MYKIAEQTGESTCKLVKGLSFKKFQSACKIAARLGSIHKDVSYLVVDTDTGEQYKVTVQ